jgi:hypothetical protein
LQGGSSTARGITVKETNIMQQTEGEERLSAHSRDDAEIIFNEPKSQSPMRTQTFLVQKRKSMKRRKKNRKPTHVAQLIGSAER